MMIRRFVLLLLLTVCSTGLFAQTTREEMAADLNRTGGVYLAYPTEIAAPTPVPQGYTPCYVSHYGRHGSRYLISDRDYKWVTDLFLRADSVNALSPLGKSLLDRLLIIADETDGRGGDLSPLGVRQHRGIAGRLFENYPQIFSGDGKSVSARSTLVVRCVLSMAAFCERLKELNPSLDVTRESSNRYMNYLCYHSPDHGDYTISGPRWKTLYDNFRESHTNPDRLMASLFSDPQFVSRNIDPKELMWGLYWIASDMQNMEADVTFYDFFTPEELFDLWQVFNLNFYINDASFGGNGTKITDNALPLIRNIIDSADEALGCDTIAATLRFGHDGNLIPLAAAMHIDNCDLVTSDPDSVFRYFAEWKIAPMAGNLQMVFFRNDTNPDDVLVKILLNEEERHIPVADDLWPYYRWNDVRSYLVSLLEKEPILPTK